MSVETLRTELFAMSEPLNAAELDALPENDPRHPTPQALTRPNEVPVETVYRTVDEVIRATLPLRHSVLYRKWCAQERLQP